ncbi:MAG TPA: NAD(P)-dependent oxidoreductase [Burkholderiaceae bacterium]|nr:NAD(P)-dependent oxidoreductase [Burkholderiaceae bacterium]
MKVLVTGGTSWFGQSIVARLLARGHDVACYDEVVEPWRVVLTRPVRCHRGSLADMAGLLAVVRRERPEVIVNREVRYGEDTETDVIGTVQINLLGALHVFEAAAATGIRRVVYESSIGVYGTQEEHGDRLLGEDDARFCNPRWVFRLTQHAVEALAPRMAASSGIELVGVRPSVCHSPLKDKGVSRWSNDFMSLPATGRPMRFPYPASQRTSLIWVDDAAEVYAALADAPRLAHPIYNTGGYDVSLGELAGMVRRMIPDAQFDFAEEGSVPPQPMPSRVCGARVERELGLSLAPLEQTLALHAEQARRMFAAAPITHPSNGR